MTSDSSECHAFLVLCLSTDLRGIYALHSLLEEESSPFEAKNSTPEGIKYDLESTKRLK